MLRRFLKNLLAYRPSGETADVRRLLDRPDLAGRPFCPPDEGDLLFRLIRRHECRDMLETGFGTGSTALYMLSASAPLGGKVTSIDWSPTEFNRLGRETVALSGHGDRHEHIEKLSQLALPELMLSGRRFDCVLFDGWRRTDHLVFELFAANRMLRTGGVFFMDDTIRKPYRAAIRILLGTYGYREVDYAAFGLGWRNRLYHVLVRRSLHRPFRAFIKIAETEDSFHD
jgi:predicted O-methyltransferase YrrM